MSGPVYIARLAMLGLILGVNAFFAAAETALLSVRDSRLRHLAAEGHAGARIALELLAQPGKLLSVTQIGVTLSSLGLGWAGEETLFSLFTTLFHPILAAPAAAFLRGVLLLAAFLLMTWCHVVIGEVVPKNIAIDKADRLAIVVAPALMVFYRVSSVFVAVVERSAGILSRALGVQPRHRRGGHSAEELKLVVSSSRFSGHLPEPQEAMIHGALDLGNVAVREIMKPRHEIVSVPATASLDEVLAAMMKSHHSRLPVWEGKPEHIVGVLFFKDMLRLLNEYRLGARAGRPAPRFRPQRMMRKPLMVPETKPLTQMLEEFRFGHTHMALVVDEFGTVTGLITVEDVLEQIVGEILDEYDEKLPAQAPTDVFEVEGVTTIRDLESLHGIELPANAGFETVAGYILFRLGHVPAAGEAVDFEGRRFVVTRMAGNRIATLRIEPAGVPAASPDPADNQPAPAVPVAEGPQTGTGEVAFARK